MKCISCGQKKTPKEMSRSTAARERCKRCVSEKTNTRRRTDPQIMERHNQRSHKAKLKRRGVIISEEEFLSWWSKAQSGNCAICGCPSSENRNGKLFIDHDHQTGKIRGLLCSSCNTALGLFKENPIIMAKAMAYINS